MGELMEVGTWHGRGLAIDAAARHLSEPPRARTRNRSAGTRRRHRAVGRDRGNAEGDCGERYNWVGRVANCGLLVHRQSSSGPCDVPTITACSKLARSPVIWRARTGKEEDHGDMDDKERRPDDVLGFAVPLWLARGRRERRRDRRRPRAVNVDT